MVFVAACPSGRGEASGTEAGRLEVEPADDRERQILRRLGVGSPSRKAQGVGSGAKAPLWPAAESEAITAKNRVISVA
jgi:hypothetical protein